MQRFQAGIYAQYYNDKDEDAEILLWFDDFNIDNKSNEIGFAHEELLRAIPDSLTEHEENTLLDWFEANYGTAYEEWYNGRADIIRQCTDLKDKNEKLIYDNDFIRAINQDTKDRPDLQIGHIWVDEMGCRWIKFKTEELSWNDFCSLIDYDGTLTIEVIGNIYENKDLVKEN